MMNMKVRYRHILILLLVVATGCATVPAGPSVAATPGPGKPFDLFQQEEVTCRQYAQQQIGASPQDTINKSTAAGAAIGGAVGAGLGALSYSGSFLVFSAITGALIGAAAGSSQGQYYGYQAQRRYDIAYQQCMYANGNMVPAVRRYYRGTPPPPPPSPDLSPSAPRESPSGPPPPP
ncbi:MAG TPA: glycine zipper family protein [Nitrospirota bacterium]|nr:glycine zipper family protein [Nitrospirota bacterium]